VQRLADVRFLVSFALLPKIPAARVNIGPNTFAEDLVAPKAIAAIETKALSAKTLNSLRLVRMVLLLK